jgi:transcriptional regulator with XRE-family HTH domain
MLLTMDRVNFGIWLASERERRGWSQSELAKRSGLHRQSLNKIENGGAMPAVETYLALAEALALSPILLFRKAGLLPDRPESEVTFDDWKFLLEQLDPAEQDELRQIAILKIDKRKKAEGAARAASFRLGQAEK